MPDDSPTPQPTPKPPPPPLPPPPPPAENRRPLVQDNEPGNPYGAPEPVAA